MYRESDKCWGTGEVQEVKVNTYYADRCWLIGCRNADNMGTEMLKCSSCEYRYGVQHDLHIDFMADMLMVDWDEDLENEWEPEGEDDDHGLGPLTCDLDELLDD